MKIRPLLIGAALALPAALLAVAAPQHKSAPESAAKKAVKPDMVYCAVTGEKFPKAQASGSSVYQGKTYYFCCAGCKPSFDKVPAKFAARAQAAEAARLKAAKSKS